MPGITYHKLVTKADWLRFLEPFTDEVKVIVRTREGFESAEATYVVADWHHVIESRGFVEPGEGLVIVQ